MKNLFVIIISILFLNTLTANNLPFTVIAVSGDVSVFSKKLDKNYKVNIEDKFDYDDKLFVKEYSLITIVDTNYNTFEITKKGIYSLNNLDEFITSKRNSIISKFTKFVLHELTVRKDNYRNMKTLGAVVRESNNSVSISVPDSTYISTPSFTFKWYSFPNNSKYLFRLLNPNNNTIYMVNSLDTSITLNISQFDFQYDKVYKWVVLDSSLPENKCDTIHFTILSPRKKNSLKNKLESLKKDFLSDSSAFNFLALANFYRSNKLYAEALPFYKKCTSLAPKSKFYWSEYLSFLLSVDLNQRAIKEWYNSPFNLPTAE